MVPVHEGGEAFRACVAALADALGPADELVVVADGETDGAWRSVPPTRATVRTVVHPVPKGPAAARNAGAGVATGRVLFFVDADVVVRPDTIERVRQRFRAEPSLAALVGSYDAAPGDPAFLSQYRNLLHHYTHQQAGLSVATFWTGCGAVRREVFVQLGGFDEGYGAPSVEDIEFGYRLTAEGGRVALDPDLMVTHLKAWRPVDMIGTDVFRRAAPWTELILRRGAVEDSLNVDRRSRGSVVGLGALVLAAAAGPAAPTFAIGLGAAAALLFLGLNAPFYRFLAHVRGPGFAVRAVPWHAVYYACAAVGFVIGAARVVTRQAPSPPRLHAEPT